MSGGKGLLEVIVEELRAAAEEEARRIVEEAEEEARRIVEEARLRAEKLREERRRQRELELKQRLARELALKRLELKRKFWNELYSMVEGALEEALGEALNLIRSNLEYRYMYLQRGLERGVASMEAASITVHPCAGDRQLVEKVVAESGERLRKIKPGLKLSVGHPIDCREGFLLVSEDGREIFNATVEARERELRQRLLPEVFKLVWGEVGWAGRGGGA